MSELLQILESPVAKTGIYGVFVILVSMVLYCFKKLVSVLEHNTEVMTKVALVIDELRNDFRSGISHLGVDVRAGLSDLNNKLDVLEKKLISRPCISKGE